MIDDFLLEVLACPRCESRPHVKLQGSLLVCTECGYGYRIFDEIPQMLPEDAIPPDEVKKENG
ncbi:MAG: Trm112 family protein [Armatimonadetes bacterium]|nr:Trm112 family protein [Armatimonadota bacterium]